MSNLNNKTSQYKSEIKEAFKSLEPDNNGLIEIKQLNELIKTMNLNQKNPFLYNTIKSLISKKSKENDDFISSKEFISFIDEQFTDDDSKEDIEKIFNIFCEGNKESFSWMKFALTMKELGDNDSANKLLKLIEQSKLLNKEVNLEEFCDILNDDYDNNIKSSNESKDYEEHENNKKTKNNKTKKEEIEEEDLKDSSSKKEDNKKSSEENDTEKIYKRYHRRYRDNKNKTENNDNVNSVNNNKVHTKYRKKK